MAKSRKASRKAGSRKSRKASAARKSATRKASATRKTRKGGDWAQAVKQVYSELKRKNPNAKLGDAMKEASRRRKAGTL